MHKSIALLRGINVGGRTVKMDRLRAVFAELGCVSVNTYIQSGNVLFDDSGEPADALAARMGEGLKAALGFEVAVLVLPAAELDAMLGANPFAGRELANGERLYVTVLDREPPPEMAARLATDPKSADEFRLTGRAAWVLCRGGYHETAYSNGFFEKKLKARATTRNLEVLTKLLELSRQP